MAQLHVVNRKHVAVFCLVMTTGLNSGIAQTTDDWMAVVALPPGQNVRVDAMQQIEGSVEHADVNGLVLVVRGRRTELPRKTVSRVVAVGSRSVGRHARNGLIIGAVAGAGVGAAAARSNRGEWVALMAIGWGGIGTLIGALEGLKHDDRVIFASSAH